jgi:SAM-dependent methyltransferase
MEKFEYPEFIARFYDTIYHTVRDGVDNDFFLGRALSVKGKVLEIGAGTGRLFTEALNKGADIFAVDISRHMVSILKSKIPQDQHYRIITADASEMKWDFKFDLIIAPFRVLSHFGNVDKQLRLLEKVNNHLTEKGRFIFDVFAPDPSLLANGIKDLTDFEGEYEPGRKIKRIINSRPDTINQILHVSMRLIWDEDGRVNDREWTFRMRYFHRFELEHLVRISPLHLNAIYGDYRLNPLSDSSKEFVVVCRKG